MVGAGVIGLAIARELSARGARVAVFERSGIGAGASGVQPGGVRQQWGTPVACRLARESAAFYAEADERLDPPAPLGFRACGYLFVAHSEATLERLAENVRVQSSEGVPSRLVSPEEAAELVPGLRGDGLAGGAWCAEDGYFDRPQSVVEAFGRGSTSGSATSPRSSRGSPTRWSSPPAPTAPISCGPRSRLPIEREERYLFF